MQKIMNERPHHIFENMGNVDVKNTMLATVQVPLSKLVIIVKSLFFFSQFKVVGISKSFYSKEKKQELLILGKDLSKSKLDFWLEKYLRFRQYPRLIQFPGK